MAISYPLNTPTTVKYRSITFIPTNIVASTASIYTGEGYHADMGGKFWAAIVDLPPMKDPAAAEWQGFLTALNGVIGTFRLPFYHRTAPRGIGTGTPVVDGASQTGTTLLTRGWTANQTGIMKSADYIRIGNFAYEVVQDADSDGTGDASLEIWPNLRTSPADGTTIVVNDVTSLFRLAAPVRFDVNACRIFGFSFSAVEAI